MTSSSRRSNRCSTCGAPLTTKPVAFVLVIRGVGGTSPSCACCLHEVLVRPCSVFIKKAVESLFIDSSLRKLNLGVFAVCCVNYGGAAYLCYLLSVPIKAPAADFIASNNILN